MPNAFGKMPPELSDRAKLKFGAVKKKLNLSRSAVLATRVRGLGWWGLVEWGGAWVATIKVVICACVNHRVYKIFYISYYYWSLG